jgi:hypothetical protein
VHYDSTALVIRQFLRKFARRFKRRKYLRKTPETKRTAVLSPNFTTKPGKPDCSIFTSDMANTAL